MELRRLNAENLKNMAKSLDWDCDGVSNYNDNCKDIYDPDQKDSNKNGIGDACEKKKKKNNRKPVRRT